MSAIEWTDETWNPIVGCSVVSPGCTNCYAMRLAGGRLRHHPTYEGLTEPSKAGPVWNGKVAFVERALAQPLHWRKPRRIFVNSMGDLFHEDVPDDWIDRVFAVMALCPRHSFQVLTKRPERMRDYLTLARHRFGSDLVGSFEMVRGAMLDGWPGLTRSKDHPHGANGMPWPLPNVWLGTSIEDTPRLARLEPLRDTPAAVRFLSLEPLLGPLPGLDLWGIDWVIAGGESGPGARPMHPDWARALRDQCQAAGVPFFFKQWGEHCPGSDLRTDPGRAFCMSRAGQVVPAPARRGDFPPGAERADRWTWIRKVGKKAAGRELDGRTWDQMPDDRYQESACVRSSAT